MAKKKKTEQKHELLYIMSPQCGWCKKADPVVDELKKKYDIRTLDVTNSEESKLAEEFKNKHNAQCGTPLFLDNITGNQVCGFRQDVLEDWAQGKEIPKPVRPTGPPPKPPFFGSSKKEEQIQVWKKEYEIWVKENNHLPNLQPVDTIVDRIKQINLQKQQSQVQTQNTNLAPDQEARLSRIEQKLDKMSKHFGVK